MTRSFYSNGKLLLTGEYAVLDGALALALPTRFGQKLEVISSTTGILQWQSFTAEGNCWLEAEIKIPDITLKTLITGNKHEAETLLQLLKQIRVQNPLFLNNTAGYHVKTILDFPRNWGLGSSSTLVSNLAKWAAVDAYALQFAVFGGSAYDIACAQHDTPILYRLKNKKPLVENVNFDPPFKDRLFFVHLNQKQNSREGIAAYKSFKGDVFAVAEKITALTKKALNALTLADFESVLAEHEQLIVSVIGQPPVQQRLFNDYSGQIKSLGAWGGDFILATGNEETPSYFKKEGYETVIPYSEMILCPDR